MPPLYLVIDREVWDAGARHDADFKGLVFTSRGCTRLVSSYGLRQEFTTPHCPHQSRMIERVIRTLQEHCVHRHRFETQQYASRVIGQWSRFCNTVGFTGPRLENPAMAYALAA